MSKKKEFISSIGTRDHTQKCQPNLTILARLLSFTISSYLNPSSKARVLRNVLRRYVELTNHFLFGESIQYSRLVFLNFAGASACPSTFDQEITNHFLLGESILPSFVNSTKQKEILVKVLISPNLQRMTFS